MENNSLTISFILRKLGQEQAEVVGTGPTVREAKRNAQEAFFRAGMPRTKSAMLAIILANGQEVDRAYGYSLKTALAVLTRCGPTTKNLRDRLQKPE